MIQHEERSLLRMTTTGSVDDGKSTLIGRLLYETNNIYEDQFDAIKKTSQKRGFKGVDFSLLLDGLAAEREQGITIDVAYRYFSTSRRKFIITDSPGHEQYTRNMVTGASNAELAIILIDARKGVQVQSKRHGFLLSLLKVPNLVVAINKMDLVNYDEKVFKDIVSEYSDFTHKLEFGHISFIPISALEGDNVVTRSENMPWYSGQTILETLESIHITNATNLMDFRFPIQYVIRPDQNFRGFAGKIFSGTIKAGEEVLVLPSGRSSTVKEIYCSGKTVSEAFAPQSIALTLSDEIDISRGDMILRKNNLPIISNEFSTMVCWMSESPLNLSKPLLLKHSTIQTKAYVSNIHYNIDINSLHRQKCQTLNLNEIGRLDIKTAQNIYYDPYKINRSTGSFILIDPITNQTVAAGMIRGPVAKMPESKSSEKKTFSLRNISQEKIIADRSYWEELNKHKGAVLWFTGFSGSGKTTIAQNLGKQLLGTGARVVLLDGDNLRNGLCQDLGFTQAERSENVRRIAEVAKLFFEQGFIVLCPLISPYLQDRQFARSLIPVNSFFEIFVNCSLEKCEERDVKGLYKKSKQGLIQDLTGVDSPYETPENPELTIITDNIPVSQNVNSLKIFLKTNGIIL